jgi:internalin A
LILDGNQITKLNGLSNLHCLTTLSVSNNRIEKIEGLDNLPLKNLNLSLNSITTINNIKRLNLIQTINLSSNQLSSLEGLNGHSYLTHVNVKENEIVELNEIQHLKDLRALRELNLKRNPIQALSDYRQFVIVSLPSLTSLDGQAISIDEKVAYTIIPLVFVFNDKF